MPVKNIKTLMTFLKGFGKFKVLIIPYKFFMILSAFTCRFDNLHNELARSLLLHSLFHSINAPVKRLFCYAPMLTLQTHFLLLLFNSTFRNCHASLIAAVRRREWAKEWSGFSVLIAVGTIIVRREIQAIWYVHCSCMVNVFRLNSLSAFVTWLCLYIKLRIIC